MSEEHTGPNGHNRLLSALNTADFALLAPHLKSSHLKQGVVLQEADDRIEQVYFPYSGMISLLAVMEAAMESRPQQSDAKARSASWWDLAAATPRAGRSSNWKARSPPLT
jgi:hypothetical protein